jgi:Sel1 repeat
MERVARATRRRFSLAGMISTPGILACWMAAPVLASQISVQSATYGGSCGIRTDNAGPSVRVLCDGQERCSYVVNLRVLGDPKPGCRKDFAVQYMCRGSGQGRSASVPGEAAGQAVAIDCSGGTAPSAGLPAATTAPSAAASDDAPLGFEVNGTCVGSCPPSKPLQPGELKGGAIAFEIKLPNGDRFAFTGQPSSTSQAGFGETQFGYDSPFAVQYLGNAEGGPSQDDTVTATLYRAFAVGHDGQIDIKPAHSAAFSLGLGEGSSAEAALSGSQGNAWVPTQRWPAAPHTEQNPMFGAFHYSVAIRNGVLHLWFRFGAHFARGSLPGSFIDFNRAKPPLLTFAQLRRGEGFTAPPDVVCSAGISADEALTRAKRAALRSANIMAMRCFLSAADSGNAGAENDVGYAAEQGLAVVPDLQEAARWYRKAAEQGDTQAQDRLAHVLVAGAPGGSVDLAEAKRWTVRADAFREARSRVCTAPSVIDGMYQVDQAISRDPEVQLSKAVAGAVTGTTVRYTPRPPFEVKVVDTPVHYGQFLVDPLIQAAEFLCQGFFTRGDDQAVALLDQNDIAHLRRERDAEEYGSQKWKDLDAAISTAEMAGGLTDFMNAQMKAHQVYVEYFKVTPLAGSRYRVTEINTPLQRSYSADVDGPVLDAPH